MSATRSRDREEAGQSPKPKEEEDERDLDLRITEYLKLGVPVGTLACAIAAGFAQGPSAVALVLAGGALVGAIAIFWASVRTLVGETPLSGADAYALGAPRAEEEQKRAVLRALKDLEFERSVGKISDDDYQALVAQYRTEAKRLLRVLEEGAEPERARVEALVQKRLARELGEADQAPSDDAVTPKPPAQPAEAKPKAKKSKAPKAEPKALDEKPKEGADGEPNVSSAVCAECGTKNDADAVFCKKCGARQGAEAPSEEGEADRDRGDREEAST